MDNQKLLKKYNIKKVNNLDTTSEEVQLLTAAFGSLTEEELLDSSKKSDDIIYAEKYLLEKIGRLSQIPVVACKQIFNEYLDVYNKISYICNNEQPGNWETNDISNLLYLFMGLTSILWEKIIEYGNWEDAYNYPNEKQIFNNPENYESIQVATRNLDKINELIKEALDEYRKDKCMAISMVMMHECINYISLIKEKKPL